MTASLKLIPLSPEECTSLLKARGKFPLRMPVALPAAALAALADAPPRNTITLKLCSRSDDVISLEGDDAGCECDHHPTVYAREYDDGRIYAATMVLGRHKITGIQSSLVSRALCDISLCHRRREGGRTTRSKTSSSSFVASMRMRKPPNDATGNDDANRHHHMVHLDGELVNAGLGEEVGLADGSIISLYGEVGFAYRVSMIRDAHDRVDDDDDDDDNDGAGNVRNGENPTGEGTTTNAKAKATTKNATNNNNNTTDRREDDGRGGTTTTTTTRGGAMTERERIRKRAHDVMTEEFTCAMCMDVLVRSTFAYPCSHVFCALCSTRIADAARAAAVAAAAGNTGGGDIGYAAREGTTTTTTTRPRRGKCPTCRGDVVEWMPARSYDAQVWSFALQGCLDASDALDYLERRASMGEDPPTEEERGSILNTCVGRGGMEEEGGGEGYDGDEDAKILRRTGVVGGVGGGNALRTYATFPSARRESGTNKFTRALPMMKSSAAVIRSANNGMQVVDLAGCSRPASQHRAKSADNNVICID